MADHSTGASWDRGCYSFTEDCQQSVFSQSAEEQRQCMSLSASCQQLPEGIQPVAHLDGSQGACRSAYAALLATFIVCA